MKKYMLELTETQALLVRDALDLYARIGLGQFEAVCDVFGRSDEMLAGIHIAKKACGFPASGSHGLHNAKVHDRFRQAWDICQVVRNKVAWERKPEGGLEVQFYKPHQTSDSEGLPICLSKDFPDRKGGHL